MCLDRAKQALADVNSTYMPSNAEQKAELFDTSIPAIAIVIFSIGGFFGGYEIRTIIVDEEHLHFGIDHSIILKPSNLPDGRGCQCDKGEFVDGIRELHIGEWRTNCMTPDDLDGAQ